jgi:hypothetical protein
MSVFPAELGGRGRGEMSRVRERAHDGPNV